MTAGWMKSNTLLALPAQTKTITASRSKQTVTADSNKVLESVVVNKFPDATGTYNVTSNGTHDMGATNNYRYISVNVGNNVRVVISVKGHLAGIADTTATVDWWGTADVNVYVNGNLNSSYTVTSGTKRVDARYTANSDTPTDAGSSDKTF